uniref:Protein kinase domain-containing protein n=1 Tax=Parascaris equorum TaxID=6256 RepID=A0A914RFQ3_PAREQ
MDATRFYSSEIVSALSHMHSLGIVHRKRLCSFVGTAQYVSPEVLNGEAVQETCDYWALGVIIYQLLTGRHAFHDESEYLIYRRILHASYDIPEE